MLQGFFADCPYELARDQERCYLNVLFVVFKLLGFYTQAEYCTSENRIDLVVQSTDYIYYILSFVTHPRKFLRISINFSDIRKTKNVW